MEVVIPKYGNFSFIKNESVRASLTFDFSVMSKRDYWHVLALCNNQDYWNENIHIFYRGHTFESLERNIFLLRYITIKGWDTFYYKAIEILYFKGI
jgi:hypothetical protein